MYEDLEDLQQSLKDTAAKLFPPPELKRKVLKELELLNDQGMLLAKVTLDTLDTDNLFDRIIQELQPGMGKAIYVVPNNPDRIISNQTQYQAIPWKDDLHSLQQQFNPYMIRTPLHADLQRIQIMYGFDGLMPHEIEGMYEEADQTGAMVITRDLRQNDTLVGMTLHYQRDQRPFELHILSTTKNRIHVPDLDRHHVERLHVQGTEAIYLSSDVQHQLFMVIHDNGMCLQYEIRASHVTKSWVLELAENLLQQG